MAEHENPAWPCEELPAPIQLTPDQLTEIAGGCDCGGVVIIIRKGGPRLEV